MLANGFTLEFIIIMIIIIIIIYIIYVIIQLQMLAFPSMPGKQADRYTDVWDIEAPVETFFFSYS